MTRPTRIETDGPPPARKVFAAAGGSRLPAFLAWIVALALAQPVAFPVMVGIVVAAISDSIYGFGAGVVIGVLARMMLISFPTDDGVA
ncbi:MAG TPA: hypothetical protein VF718_10235 [Allosphingosinicella sp.]|jgi:hypothetical protein